MSIQRLHVNPSLIQLLVLIVACLIASSCERESDSAPKVVCDNPGLESAVSRLRVGMSYASARETIICGGWQPFTWRTPNYIKSELGEFIINDMNYPEFCNILDNNDTYFIYSDPDGRTLVINMGPWHPRAIPTRLREGTGSAEDRLKQWYYIYDFPYAECYGHETEEDLSYAPPSHPAPSGVYVNSPGDGFLAMRSEPSVRRGYRIRKIPHGASVEVGACGPSTSVGSTPGRWCEVSYGGQYGYAFDAWLVRR